MLPLHCLKRNLAYFGALALSAVAISASAAPQLRAYVLAGIYSDTQTSTSPVSTTRTFSNSDGTAYGRSSADYGVLRVYGEAQTGAKGTGYNHTGAGQASWQDTITIDSPGLTGTSGSMDVKFEVDGTLAATGAGADSYRAMSRARFEFSHNGSIVLSGLQSIYNDGGTFYDGTAPFLGDLQTVKINFIYGTPFDLKLYIETVNRTYTYAGGEAKGDLSNTATWGGITNVRDSNNQPVSNFSASSVSGADYVNPIVPPKPQLSVALQGANLEISWSTNFTGYLLQDSSTLQSNSWNTVTNVVNSNGSNSVVTIPASASPKFYRLKQQ